MLVVVDVLVLGPVRVVAATAEVTLDRPLERALLVRLALAAGTPVPDGQLAEDLWGRDIERPVQRLRVVVSRLRSALGPHADLVGRTPAGYHTTVTARDLTVARAAVEQLHRARRSGDHAAAAAAAGQALALWRGPSLGDLRAVPYAAAEGERLDDWRLELTVAGLDATLELGAGGEVLAELTGLVAGHPLHEPLCRLLALALYRVGRQADSLERLARLRRTLADELGVDPAPATAELEFRILNHDPDLMPRTRFVSTAPGPPPTQNEETNDRDRSATGFVGRAHELATVAARVSVPGLTTVVAVAGAGKSRLAVEIARIAARAGRTVVFVELAPLRRAEDVPHAVSAALEASGLAVTDKRAGADPVAAMTAAVHGLDRPLLVIDNAEHLVEPLAELAAALLGHGENFGGTTGPSLLVTSQRPLGLSGESVYPLGPLDRGVAVALFAQRAGLDRLLTAQERSQLVTICAAVDWLPLGIELAAGLTRVLTISQLARRIDDRVRLLVGGPRDAVAGRHSSLRMALDWSHELLDDRERMVLRGLGVFAGGCTLEAAESVIPDGKLEIGDIAPALAHLVNRSLVTVHADGENRRFLLLETVRDYAQTQLARAGETEAARSRHLDWCRELVRDIGEPEDFADAADVAAVFAEWANISAALENSSGTPRAADGLRLALDMHVPWLARAWFREARRHYDALVDAPGVTTAERAHALSHNGFHALMVGSLDTAAELLDRAEQLAEPSDDEDLAQTVRYYRGIVDIERCKLPEAVARLREGERLSPRATQAASFSDALGTALLYAGDSAGALAAYRRSIAVDRAHDDEHGLSRGLSNEAKALLALGRTKDALAAAAESDTYARRLDDRQILPLNDLTRAAAALAGGEFDAAESYCRAALAHEEEAMGLARVDLADVLLAAGELVRARKHLDEFRAAAHSRMGEHSVGVAWLAHRTIEVALRRAEGDPTAEQLADEVRTAHATAGFGWQRYTDRLAPPPR